MTDRTIPRWIVEQLLRAVDAGLISRADVRLVLTSMEDIEDLLVAVDAGTVTLADAQRRVDDLIELQRRGAEIEREMFG